MSSVERITRAVAWTSLTSSCIRRVCVVVLKRRKRRRVALNVTLKARAFFCVDVEGEWSEKKQTEKERFFKKEESRESLLHSRWNIYRV
mmetsp:Transcript_1605/g.5050  ORF Transcript_1605/g.5050 Transcript_1605/m.5050 type:complete len:89 (-) Transcript_1605:1800-2066(-)